MGLAALVVWSFTRRSPLGGSSTYIVATVHVQKLVRQEEKHVQRFAGAVEVDIIGGDFNIAAFGTVGTAFDEPKCSPIGPLFLWGLGALDDDIRENCGFLFLPNKPHPWRVIDHGAFVFNNEAMGLGPYDLLCAERKCHRMARTGKPGQAKKAPKLLVVTLFPYLGIASAPPRRAWTLFVRDFALTSGAAPANAPLTILVLSPQLHKDGASNSPVSLSNFGLIDKTLVPPFSPRMSAFKK